MGRVLAYWRIRGLGQPIRLLLNYVGEDFEDRYYDRARDQSSAWFDIKHTLGFDFPNLPFYIDGDLKLTQANAILRYIGRKHGLCGKTDEETAHVDVMLDTAMDFRNDMVTMIYHPLQVSKLTFNEALKVYMEKLPDKLKTFEKHLDGKLWFTGNNITAPDFHMYELLEQHRLMDLKCLETYPNIKAFLERFENLPNIKAYMASEKFVKWPLNNTWGHIGTTDTNCPAI